MYIKKSPSYILLVVAILIFGVTQAAGSQAAEIAAAPQQGIRIAAESATELRLNLKTPDYQIAPLLVNGQAFDQIQVSGGGYLTTPGQPQLPTVQALIGIPPDATVRVEIIAADSQILPGTYAIAPVPTQYYAEDFSQGSQLSYLPAADIYNRTALFPNNLVDLGAPAWVRNQRIVQVNFYPFQYNPQTGTLTVHHNIQAEIRFEFEGASPTAGQKPGLTDLDTPFDALLADQLLNYEAAKAWRQNPATIAAATNTMPQAAAGQNRYRLGVLADGLYKISYADLAAHMADIDSVDPRHFQVTSQGAAVNIYVTGEADGSFDPGDAIYFYGQKFYGDRLAALTAAEDDLWRSTFYESDKAINWTPQNTAQMLEKYTDENVYWLLVGASDGDRMPAINADPTGNTQSAEPHFRESVHTEESFIWYTNHFTSEDSWYWSRVTGWFEDYVTTYTTTLTAVATTPISATVRGEILVKNFSSNPEDQHTGFRINAVDLIEEVWDNDKPATYAFEVDIDPAGLVSGVNTLYFTSYGDGDVSIRHYFNWFEVDYQRLFEAQQNALKFSQTTPGPHRYEISQFSDTTNLLALDITHPLTPTRLINPGVGATTASISATNTATATYFVASDAAAKTPSIAYYPHPDLLNASNAADYVFITHADFFTTTETLANYRQSQGHTTRVVDVADVYNEFLYGIQNPLAIKYFLKYAVENWATPPNYALLIGDGHWNFKGFNTAEYSNHTNYMPPYLAWVDPWQGEIESTNLLANFIGSDPLPDIHIGRLPVNSTTELSNAITKIIQYEAAATAPWQFRMLFVADNPDSAGNFSGISDEIINDYVGPQPLYTADRIYQEDYSCTSGSSAQCQAVTAAITATLNTTGTLIMSYHGHGSGRLWSNEVIFETGDIPLLNNGDRLPVILSLDCWDGTWSFPYRPSSTSFYPGLIEELVRTANAGAIAGFSPSGLGVASGHDELHRGFLAALFESNQWEIGPAAYNARLNYYSHYASDPYLLHTYTIIGDPALRIHRPESVFLPLVQR